MDYIRTEADGQLVLTQSTEYRYYSVTNVSKLRLDIFEGMVKNRNIELLLRSWIAAHAGS